MSSIQQPRDIREEKPLNFKIVLTSTLETVINQALRLDPASQAALIPLTGKVISITLSSVEQTIFLFIDKQQIMVMGHYEGTVNTAIQGPPFTLLHLLLQPDASLSDYPAIHLQGEIGTAQQFFNILRQLEIDWEDYLAQWLGDAPAHQMGTWLKQGQAYLNERLTQIPLNLKDYLQEEIRTLPASAEADAFFNAVDTLRDDLERLEQRVHRLQAHLPSSK